MHPLVVPAAIRPRRVSGLNVSVGRLGGLQRGAVIVGETILLSGHVVEGVEGGEKSATVEAL